MADEDVLDIFSSMSKVTSRGCVTVSRADQEILDPSAPSQTESSHNSLSRSSGTKLFDIEALNYIKKTKAMFQRL